MNNTTCQLENRIQTIYYFLRTGWNWRTAQKITMNLLIRIARLKEFEYDLSLGVPRLVLYYDDTKPGQGITEPCLFCGMSHIHGTGEGHRVPHCSSNSSNILFLPELIHEDGTVIKHDHGYILKYRKD